MDVEKLMETGVKLGYEGVQLQEFVSQQLEREDRKRHDDMEREDRKRHEDMEREDRKRQDDLEREGRKRQDDLDRDERALIRDEKRRHEEMEMKRLELELEEKKLKVKTDVEHHHGGSTARAPKLPPFNDSKDDLDAYLGRFEQYAKVQKWPTENWATNLSALLTGKALETYSRLHPDDLENYNVLKEALLMRFQLTEDGFRGRFYQNSAEEGETAEQFMTRLQRYLERWMDLAGTNKTYEELRDLLIREHFITACHKELTTFLRERKLQTLKEMKEAADNYVQAHGGSLSKLNVSARKSTPKYQQSDQNQQRKGPTCHKCGKFGHIAPRCRTILSQDNSKQSAITTSDTFREIRKCYACGRNGHIAKNCRVFDKPIQKAAMGIEGTSSEQQNYQDQNNGSQDNTNSETHCPIQNMYASCSCRTKACPCHAEHPVCFVRGIKDVEETFSEGFINNGEKYYPVCNTKCDMPVPGSYCNNLPTAQGYINSTRVQVMRDSGCSGAVVKKDFVKQQQYTGKYRLCLLVDGTVRKVPVAEITVDSPYYKGITEAMVMDTPVYDLILGNIPGVREVGQPDPNWKPNVENQSNEQRERGEIGAVITRAQAEFQKKPTVPLKVPEPENTETIKQQELATQQKEDPSLNKLFSKLNAEPKVTPVSENWLEKKSGILYRFHQNTKKPGKPVTKQLVVPKPRRTQVLQLAHEAIMGGHMGRQRTMDKILSNFYWPGINGDVTRYCQSCDICQRTTHKGKTAKAPLDQMPFIDVPFRRIAVDIVGPISPISDQGNRYILTMIDYATRYPEAKALKNIDTETVAEALLEIYSRMGFPEEVLTDRGSQFTSAMMREVNRLISVRQLTTTPYHPMCNGLVERYNGVLKQMLKRLCSEQPKQWDRYIPAILFAYREVPQESLGYAPFELLYGRAVRGPMDILRTVWTKEIDEPKVETSYQYVIDLKNCVEETCKIAREELFKASRRYKKYFDKKTRPRKLDIGDQVLILLPTDNNKLAMQWKGPFNIKGQTAKYDYLVDIKGKVKTFHINMLKAYKSREEETGLFIAVVASAVIEDEEEHTEGTLKYFEVKLPESNETYLDVHYADTLSPQQLIEAKNLVYEYRDIFSDVPGTTNLTEHNINLTTEEPIRLKPYPLPFATREMVKGEVGKMLEAGVIERTVSPYSAPVVLVHKKDGSIRFCIDYRRLNNITIFDTEPMPSPEYIFSKLQGDKYFSKIDLSKGYWQVPIRKEDRPKTAFVTPDGCYQFRKMPFGLINATATFNRLMRKVTRQIEKLDSFVDDLLGHTPTWLEQVQVLRPLFEHLRQGRLTVRPTKCFIGYQSLVFVGHQIQDGSLHPHPDKVAEIVKAPRPETKRQVRSFLGLVGYYRTYIPNFATIAAPLTDLTKKVLPTKVKWTAVEEVSFQRLKTFVTQDPVLKVPDFDKTFILQTDASERAAGAALMQEQDGLKFPISYASRKFSDAERAYSTIEKECLALIWAVHKFQTYLYGKEFIVETDHQPLVYINHAKMANSRVMRWAMILQNYRFTVHSIKGTDNVLADYMSRTVSESD